MHAHHHLFRPISVGRPLRNLGGSQHLQDFSLKCSGLLPRLQYLTPTDLPLGTVSSFAGGALVAAEWRSRSRLASPLSHRLSHGHFRHLLIQSQRMLQEDGLFVWDLPLRNMDGSPRLALACTMAMDCVNQ